MHVRYDAAADALSIRFREAQSTTRPFGEGIVGAYDAAGQLVGIEIRNAKQHLGDVSTLRQVVREGLGPPICHGMPASTIVAEHIVLDERGRPWVDDTNTKVIEVVLDHVAWLLSPEAIHRAHPHLSLAQIYAALAYYHDHKSAFDAEIERQYQEHLVGWQAQQDSPLLQKLRAAGKSA